MFKKLNFQACAILFVIQCCVDHPIILTASATDAWNVSKFLQKDKRPLGATVARLTRDQMVAFSNHVEVYSLPRRNLIF